MKQFDPKLADWLESLLQFENVHFKEVRPRKTKLGDFRVFHRSKKRQITINSDLEVDLYLSTFLHEIAHAQCYRIYGRKVAPHGMEWKNLYLDLLSQSLEFPLKSEVKSHIIQCIKKPRASFKNTSKPENAVLVSQLKEGSQFTLERSNKVFIKGAKMRTRYKCREKNSLRHYSVSGNAVVTNCYS